MKLSKSIVLALFLAGTKAQNVADFKNGAPSNEEPILLDTIMKELPNKKGDGSDQAMNTFNDKVEDEIARRVEMELARRGCSSTVNPNWDTGMYDPTEDKQWDQQDQQWDQRDQQWDQQDQQWDQRDQEWDQHEEPDNLTVRGQYDEAQPHDLSSVDNWEGQDLNDPIAMVQPRDEPFEYLGPKEGQGDEEYPRPTDTDEQYPVHPDNIQFDEVYDPNAKNPGLEIQPETGSYCPPGFIVVNGQCEPDPVTNCPEGFTLIDGDCMIEMQDQKESESNTTPEEMENDEHSELDNTDQEHHETDVPMQEEQEFNP